MRAPFLMSPCLLLMAAACADGVDGSPQGKPVQAVMVTAAIEQPAGTVVVNFSVDDTANKVYGAGDLRWKGSFLVDPATRTLTFDDYWSGGPDGASGWPLLYDDGPWSSGGHEPDGATAGDHVWGITVFVAPPASGTVDYAYGLNDTTLVSTTGGWIWQGPNGTFSVSAGDSGPITAPGMTFRKFGTSDLVLVLDTHHLSPSWDWNTSTVTVKGSAWGWIEVPMVPMSHGEYLFTLSSVVGTGKQFPHSGLLNPGDVPEFVFVLGGEEYKDWFTPDDGQTWYGVAPDRGVSASILSPCPPSFRMVHVTHVDNGNTVVTVPATHCNAHFGW